MIVLYCVIYTCSDVDQGVSYPPATHSGGVSHRTALHDTSKFTNARHAVASGSVPTIQSGYVL